MDSSDQLAPEDIEYIHRIASVPKWKRTIEDKIKLRMTKSIINEMKISGNNVVSACDVLKADLEHRHKMDVRILSIIDRRKNLFKSTKLWIFVSILVSTGITFLSIGSQVIPAYSEWVEANPDYHGLMRLDEYPESTHYFIQYPLLFGFALAIPILTYSWLVIRQMLLNEARNMVLTRVEFNRYLRMIEHEN